MENIKERASSIPIILFGNKVDYDNDKWEDNSEEDSNFAEKMELIYFEVSAKIDKGINEGISYLVNDIYDSLEEEQYRQKLKD